MHDYVCFNERTLSLTPYVGDVQLIVFVSFVQNQVSWKVKCDTITFNEARVKFPIRNEVGATARVAMAYNRMW